MLLKQVNLHSGLFLAILTLGYAATLCGYFIISDLEAVDGMMVRRHSTLEKSIRCSRFVLLALLSTRFCTGFYSLSIGFALLFTGFI